MLNCVSEFKGNKLVLTIDLGKCVAKTKKGNVVFAKSEGYRVGDDLGNGVRASIYVYESPTATPPPAPCTEDSGWKDGKKATSTATTSVKFSPEMVDALAAAVAKVLKK